MLKTCSLCGKLISSNSILCFQCSEKIKNEYEVNMPNEEKDNLPKKTIRINNNKTNNSKFDMNFNNKKNKVKRPFFNIMIFILVITIVIIGASIWYYNYSQNIKKDNIDQIAWNTAVGENLPESYIKYMKENPNGKYYNTAENNLHSLKITESEEWLKIKSSDNISELLNFSKSHIDSPYKDLIDNRIDSIYWMSIMKLNNYQSYSDYISKSNNQEIKGNYIGEAQKRSDMLKQTYSVNDEELKNLKERVDKFFTAISLKDSLKMSLYFAPVVKYFFSYKEQKDRDELINIISKQMDTYNIDASLEDLQYDKNPDGSFNINIPYSINNSNKKDTLSDFGYIAHIELTPDSLVSSVYETKPYSDFIEKKE